MQWSVVLVVVLWVALELVHGGALRCVPGEGSTCVADETEMGHPVRMAQAISGKEKGQSKGVSCLIGSAWANSCGACRCSEAGRAVCQRRGDCSATEVELEQQCAPDTMWRNDCNTCWCSEHGRAMCTRIGCPYVLPEKPQSEENSPIKPVPEANQTTEIQAKLNAEKKEEATRAATDLDHTGYSDVEIGKENLEPLDHSFEELDYNIYEPENDLNHVHIIQDQSNLLEQLEVHDKEQKHNLLKRSVCKPSEIFQAECNACKCAPDGQSYTCTHNECMEGEKNKEVEVFMESEGEDHIERHMVCAARGTFYIGCNTCHCNALGTDYSCSNKPCPLPEDVELFHELKTVKSSNNRSTKQVCVANRMFIKECNTCWCNEDGTSFVCTRRVCAPELPEVGATNQPEELRIVKKECRPGEVFELDCNMCHCNPDGKSYSCTRRACVDLDHPVVEPVDQPVVQDAKELPVVELVDQPVVEHVVAKNQSLVRKTRSEELRKNCQPGQEFRMDCNTCLCDDQGKDFSCTRHDCNGGNGESTRSKRETSESTAENVTMECVAGSVFNRDCNVCRCEDDGKQARCTHKPCVAPTPAPASRTDGDTSPAPESDPNFRCNPGEQLKRGCNDCQCSADGRSVFCTVRYCDQDITPPPPSV